MRKSEKHLILSGYVTKNSEIKNALEVRNVTFDRQDLALNLAEADQRIILHLHKTVTEVCKKAIVLCNDTDVLALLLYYIHEFMSNGLSDLWMKFGIGDSSRFIPLHFLASQLGPRVCSVIIKAHILTGCDITSKIGTKVAALKCKPEKYLMTFGDIDDNLSYRNVEQYLVKVMYSSSNCTTFDELLYEIYTSKKKSINELPPTSESIQSHLDRCHFLINQYINLISDAKVDLSPYLYGWKRGATEMLPVKNMKTLPKSFYVTCGCQKQCSRRCKCFKNDVSCSEFCKCKFFSE